MKLPAFTKILIPFVIFAVLVGIFLNYTDSSKAKLSKQCNLDLKQECEVFSSNQQVSVQFLQTIELEEELFFIVKVPKDLQINKLWVQGINMYMGKNIPQIDSTYIEDDKKIYKVRLFLGACSEPLMKWQLVIQTSQTNQSVSEETSSWFFNFSTDRNKTAG